MINSVAFSPDGSQVLTGECKNDIFSGAAVRLWDMATGSLIRTIISQSWFITSMAFSPDGSRVLIGSASGTASLWDASTGEGVASFSPGYVFNPEVGSVSFSPDGRMILVASDYTRLWDVTTKVLIRTFPTTSCVAFSSDGHMVFAGFKLWDTATWAVLRTFDNTLGISSVVFSPDGKKVLTGTSSGTAMLWDITGGPKNAADSAAWTLME
jgi:WD40 repeat protein